MSLDLLVVSPDLAEVWAGRLVVPWTGRQITIVSRAGLATMKRMAGRPQDLADLAALEGVCRPPAGVRALRRPRRDTAALERLETPVDGIDPAGRVHLIHERLIRFGRPLGRAHHGCRLLERAAAHADAGTETVADAPGL